VRRIRRVEDDERRRLAVFREAGALLEGHFILPSGAAKPVFLQKALVFSQPGLVRAPVQRRCRRSSPRHSGKIDVCAGPAVGGIIPGYELRADTLRPTIFAEPFDGKLAFRPRVFAIAEASAY